MEKTSVEEFEVQAAEKAEIPKRRAMRVSRFIGRGVVQREICNS